MVSLSLTLSLYRSRVSFYSFVSVSFCLRFSSLHTFCVHSPVFGFLLMFCHPYVFTYFLFILLFLPLSSSLSVSLYPLEYSPRETEQVSTQNADRSDFASARLTSPKTLQTAPFSSWENASLGHFLLNLTSSWISLRLCSLAEQAAVNVATGTRRHEGENDSAIRQKTATLHAWPHLTPEMGIEWVLSSMVTGYQPSGIRLCTGCPRCPPPHMPLLGVCHSCACLRI